ncbi:glutamate--tRNA ligase [Streptomyces diastatochromogenes]|uniref:Glutamate--tRNA ligase n=1 Tax=Streptomyces diastatochromogenes TaxID=42236 RepID=A0A233SJ83_STRDA|nr:glutamate--tRNA ligase family protein [Streptomyces diastatochromogenes]MCZ0988712.1 glutamate--tRNA ligase family protein [Streptomyces diastatochromogenes]OXY95714.1 glutamate--tRNA ligase [Streptomyces diastatochromogenes]
MLDASTIDALFPADLPEPAHWEQRYPARDLPAGAQVTRLAPSPTGFVHIGGIYAGLINQAVAHRTGGRYLVRIEDTDQSRQVDGAIEQFNRAFDYFTLPADSPTAIGDYGPYLQSARQDIYLSHVRALLRTGQAYLCFATQQELADIRQRQEDTKVPTGYYGDWAIWRDADPGEVTARLAEGAPYVVRFRSPALAGARRAFTDAIRGRLEHEDNRNDVVILKSSDSAVRLPTYHFAHVVDDHLMRVNLVIRGEEWISSVPVHLQLFEALGFEPPVYAHIAPLMKQIKGGKRKLSKRKDPESTVDFYLGEGYPAEPVLHYLRGLANGRLAELPLAQALQEPIRLEDCGVAGPLVDLVKLEGISADHIATLTSEQILTAVREWALSHDPDLVPVLDAERTLALAAVDVERVGVDNPRKDLRKWADFRDAYGFFFPQLFTPVAAGDERLGGLDEDLVRAFAQDFADRYAELDDPQAWFDQIRTLAAQHGFAATPKEFKKNPDAYPGSIREASQLIRVALTGSTRSPDLFAVARTLGREEVLHRVTTLTS